MNENYYHVLGLDNFSSVEDVKVAYRKLVKKYHPDKNPGKPENEEIFKRISNAYSILSNPESKATYDDKLNHKINPPARPKYARAPYYSSKKKQYTPTAWMYAKIFIIVFIMAIVLIPLTLLYQSSVRYYEKGLEEYGNGHISSSLLNFNSAISQFGGRSVQAGIKASEIYLYDLNDYKQTKFFANRALEFAEKDSDFAYLYYLRGIANYGESNFDLSLQDFLKSDSLHYRRDSITLKLGYLYTFGFNDFFKGEEMFDSLLAQDIKPDVAWFGKGWCQQETNRYRGAVNSFSKVLSYNDSSALVYFYRGRNYLHMEDSAAACNDFEISKSLGYSRAENLFDFYCTADSLAIE